MVLSFYNSTDEVTDCGAYSFYSGSVVAASLLMDKLMTSYLTCCRVWAVYILCGTIYFLNAAEPQAGIGVLASD